ncbi:MAG: hypothetical protein RLZZ499_2668 [Cyanobacteriota bacterium]
MSQVINILNQGRSGRMTIRPYIMYLHVSTVLAKYVDDNLLTWHRDR